MDIVCMNDGVLVATAGVGWMEGFKKGVDVVYVSVSETGEAMTSRSDISRYIVQIFVYFTRDLITSTL